MTRTRIETARDIAGYEIRKGDTVSTVNDHVTARVCDLALEGGTAFVRIRPLHQPYARGLWYAAEQVLLLTTARRREPQPAKKPRSRPVRAAARKG